MNVNWMVRKNGSYKLVMDDLLGRSVFCSFLKKGLCIGNVPKWVGKTLL